MGMKRQRRQQQSSIQFQSSPFTIIQNNNEMMMATTTTTTTSCHRTTRRIRPRKSNTMHQQECVSVVLFIVLTLLSTSTTSRSTCTCTYAFNTEAINYNILQQKSQPAFQFSQESSSNNLSPSPPRLLSLQLQSTLAWEQRKVSEWTTTTTNIDPINEEDVEQTTRIIDSASATNTVSDPKDNDDNNVDNLHANTHLSTATSSSKITTASTALPKSPSSASTISKSFPSTLHLWKHRLITKEDRKHMHKITGMIFVIASWGLSYYGIRDMIQHGWTRPVSVHGTPFQILLWTLVTSSIVQSFSSIRLACSHRKGQRAVRNTFLCNAVVAILGSVSALWSSTWYPSYLNGTFSKCFYLIMDLVGLIGMGDNLYRLKDLISSRQNTFQDKHNIEQISHYQYWKDVFVYMMPILIGAPFFLGIGYQFGIRHDRTYYLNILQRPNNPSPHLQAGAVYSMIMVAIGASYSSVIVTLRDKKLIRKRTEGLSLTAIMICLIGSLYQAMKDPGTIATIMGM